MREGLCAVVLNQLDHRVELEGLHKSILAVPLKDLDQFIAATLPEIQKMTTSKPTSCKSQFGSHTRCYFCAMYYNNMSLKPVYFCVEYNKLPHQKRSKLFFLTLFMISAPAGKYATS